MPNKHDELIARLRDKGLAFSMFDRDIAADLLQRDRDALVRLADEKPFGRKYADHPQYQLSTRIEYAQKTIEGE